MALERARDKGKLHLETVFARLRVGLCDSKKESRAEMWGYESDVVISEESRRRSDGDDSDEGGELWC